MIRCNWCGEIHVQPAQNALEARACPQPKPDVRVALRDLVEFVEVALDAGLLLSVDGKRPDVMCLERAKQALEG